MHVRINIFGLEQGYNEIQRPKRKNVLIDYERLRKLLGFDKYKNLQAAYRKWIASGLEKGSNARNEKRTASLALGSKTFVEEMQVLMGASARGRKPRETEKSYQLREAQSSYSDDFGVKKCERAIKNAFSWH